MSAPLARYAKKARYLAALALMLSAASTHAQDWGATATISSTMGISDSRICTGEGTRGDIGCTTNAPYVSRTTGWVGVNTTYLPATLSVSGSFSVLNSQVGITLSSYGETNKAYLESFLLTNSNQKLPLLLNRWGGLVGIGSIDTPSTTLHVGGSIRIMADATACDTNRTGAIKFESGEFYVCKTPGSWSILGAGAGGSIPDRIVSGTAQVIASNGSSTVSLVTNNVQRVVVGSSGDVGINQQPTNGYALAVSGSILSNDGIHISYARPYVRFFGVSTTSLVMRSNGSMALSANRLGIGLEGTALGIDPATALDVSGTIRMGDSGETCSTDTRGAIKYLSGVFYVCRNGSSWETLAAAAGGTNSDRIISGTTQVIANNNTSISLVTAGTERVVIGTTGSVGIGQQPVAATALSVSGSSQVNGVLSVQNGSSAPAAYSTLRIAADVGEGALTYYSSGYSSGWATSNTMELAAYGATTGGLQLRNSNANGFIRFLPANSLEAMRITANGNIGVGITAPAFPLDVSGSGAVARFGTSALSNQYIAVRDGNGGAFLGLSFNYTANGDAVVQGGSDKGLAFVTNSSTFAGLTPAMYIARTRQVGINTLAPSTSLHVVGTLRLADGGEACDANRLGGIRFTGGTFYVCKTAGSWDVMSTSGAAAATDRIISGTTQVIANNNTSISLVTAGTERLIIGTTGSVGIGQQPGVAALGVSGGAVITGNLNVVPAGAPTGSIYALQPVGTGYGLRMGLGDGSGGTLKRWDIRSEADSSLQIFESTTGGATGNARLTFANGGNIGIGTDMPSTTLHVSGSTRVTSGTISVNNANTTVSLNGNTDFGSIEAFGAGVEYLTKRPIILNRWGGNVGIGGLNIPSTTLHIGGAIRISTETSSTLNTCDANRIGAIRFTAGEFSFCRVAATGWETLASIGSGGSTIPDRIVSGTAYVQTNSNNTVSISGTTFFGNGTATSTGLEIGSSPTGNRTAYIDLIGDTTYTDYGLRILRGNGGANAGSSIAHRGTGALNLQTLEAAPITFTTSNSESMRITADGNIGIGTNAPSTSLVVSGTITLTNGGGLETRIDNNAVIFNRSAANGANAYFGNAASGGSVVFHNSNTNVGILTASGQLGLLTTVPSTSLHVVGSLRIANGGEACDANRIGAIRFAAGEFSFCRVAATGWETLASIAASGATTPDRIISSTTAAVIANQSGGTVSFTLGGTAGRAYLHSTAGLVAPAVSTTVGNVQGMRMLASTAGDAAATPGFGWVGDSDTGMFRAAADTLAFTTAGTESMRILANGNVGIGLSNPTSQLHVSGTAAIVATNAGTEINGATLTISNGSTGDSVSSWMISGRRWYAGLDNSDNDSWKLANTSGTPNFDTDTILTATVAGNIGIGKSNPATDLDVSGSIQYTGTITDVSDRRTKMNIEALPFASATQKLSQLAAVQFEMKSAPGKKEYGFIAQDVEKVLPTLVVTNTDPSSTKALNYMGLIPLLVQSNQELAAENAQLKANQADILRRLNALEKR
ncbi:MAG: tail fiber domain-containing protein [Alphaproteobacteria bacterium]|nr:MAG: tail fiber domain-containing protein [Alphaproteobacteria bacterium]